MANTVQAMRKIIHVDMDAFYAAVEQRDQVQLRGKPVIVGGDPHRRGVVATCSYEARKFGIHSAMPTHQAYKLCPQGIFIPPDFKKYQAVSKQIREIFLRYTPLIEPLSLDEAYLDVSEIASLPGQAVALARQILYAILQETGLTASAGVSYNKFLAKTASDFKKPFGLTVVTPAKAQAFIDALPIRRFYGVGPATEKIMLSLGIRCGADLRRQSQQTLTDHFGKAGDYFYQISRGIDERPVCVEHQRKSLSVEETFERDLFDIEQIKYHLAVLVRRLWQQMNKEKISGRRLILKVRYHDFQTVSRSKSIDDLIRDEGRILNLSLHLLHQTEADRRSVRLLGIGIADLEGLAIDEVNQGKTEVC